MISDSCADVKDKIAGNKHGVTVTNRNSTAGKRQHRGSGRKACVARGRSREENRAQTKQDPGPELGSIRLEPKNHGKTQRSFRQILKTDLQFEKVHPTQWRERARRQ